MRRKGVWRPFLSFLLGIFCIYALISFRFKPINTICEPQIQDQNEKTVESVIKVLKEDLARTGTGSETAYTSQISTRDFSMFPGFDQLALGDLESNAIPNHIYYVWCLNRTIGFVQYLSIMAAWKTMRPDAITLFTQYDISDKSEHYNFWLTDLLTSIAGFRVKKIPKAWDGQENGCGVWFAIAVLDDVGGIYFDNELFLLKSARFIRRNNFALATTIDTKNISYVASIPGNERLKKFKKLYRNVNVSPMLIEGMLFCDKIVNINRQTTNSSLCVHIKNALPVQIMHLNSTIGSMARKTIYGQTERVEVKQLLPGFIPKIFHMVWFGNKVMDLMMYLCLKSILTIVKPNKVYIHGDGGLSGDYFDQLKKDPRLVFVYRETPEHVFGHRILYMQHRSDIIRADVLLKYGGIYSDWDVLWLKPIDDLISKQYDTILNFDHMPRPGYPDSINLGVLMSKPGAHFVKHWQDSLVNYRSRDFYFNAIELPYKTFEKYPSTVHIEPHLQVMCYYLKCHPTFHPQYRNFNVAQPFNWTTDTYSIHFTYPDPPGYANETALSKSKGMFTDIANHILSQPFENVGYL